MFFWAREVSKKLPGGRSSVLTEYEPEASHGDPIHAPKTGSRRPGRYLKSFLEAARFFWTPREPVASHGGPIHAQNYGLGCVVLKQNACFVLRDQRYASLRDQRSAVLGDQRSAVLRDPRYVVQQLCIHINVYVI